MCIYKERGQGACVAQILLLVPPLALDEIVFLGNWWRLNSSMPHPCYLRNIGLLATQGGGCVGPGFQTPLPWRAGISLSHLLPNLFLLIPAPAKQQADLRSPMCLCFVSHSILPPGMVPSKPSLVHPAWRHPVCPSTSPSLGNLPWHPPCLTPSPCYVFPAQGASRTARVLQSTASLCICIRAHKLADCWLNLHC